MIMIMHIKLHVHEHKAVIVGANLKSNYLQFTNFYYSFPCIFCYQLTLKNISRGYAQQK